MNENEQLAELQTEFERIVRSGAFQPVARFVAGACDAEDRLAEGIGSAWRTYRDCATRQEKHLGPGALVQHCKWRAIDRSRRLASDGSRAKNHDALSEHAYLKGRTEVLRYELPPLSNAGAESHLLAGGLARHGLWNPSRTMISAVDLRDWLTELPEQDRDLLLARYVGHDLESIARMFNISTATAFRRLRQLGFQLAAWAEIGIPASCRTPSKEKNRHEKETEPGPAQHAGQEDGFGPTHHGVGDPAAQEAALSL